MDETTIRVTTADDAGLLRAVRMRMLAEHPAAYIETLAESERHSDEVWRERAGGSGTVQVLALDGAGAPGGAAAGVLSDGVPVLVGVYLAPPLRGRGVLERMVAPVVEWARERGPELVLEVGESNERAVRAYARLGFVPNGRRRPHPRLSGEHEIEMIRSVAPA